MTGPMSGQPGPTSRGPTAPARGSFPFLKVANDTAVAVNQGGKRKGAMCAYLETWHLDIEDFLELRKNTGDERRRTHDMNTANWIPDLFMKRVKENMPSGHSSIPARPPTSTTSTARPSRHATRNTKPWPPRAKSSSIKEVEAVNLYRRMLTMLFETGHPWFTFKDPSNIRSPAGPHRGGAQLQPLHRNPAQHLRGGNRGL
jgi:ribonucleoside-diphosphate reductase alpha chain